MYPIPVVSKNLSS